MKTGLAFHYHHDTLCVYVFDYDKRVGDIKRHKPKDEVDTRLRLFRMIPNDRIPGRESAEWAAYDKARVVYIKEVADYNKVEVVCITAGVAYDKAKAAYIKAGVAYTSKYSNELEQLHKELCPDCPWDGKTIFPEIRSK